MFSNALYEMYIECNFSVFEMFCGKIKFIEHKASTRNLILLQGVPMWFAYFQIALIWPNL